MKHDEFEKLADLLAKSHRITVRRDMEWKANIKTREVFYAANDIYGLPDDHVMGLLLHEIAHIHYTTDVNNEGDPYPELTHTARNAVEDVSIEHLISKDYANAGEILASTEEELLDVLIRMLPTLKTSPHEKALLYGSVRFRGRGYANPITDYEKVGEKIADIMKKNKTLIYNRKRTQELNPMSREMSELLVKEFGAPPPEDKNKMQQQMQGSQGKQSHDMRQDVKGQIIKMLKNGGGGFGEDLEMMNDGITYIASLADQAKDIGKKIRSTLKRNQAMEFGGRYKTGKLLAKRISRVRTNKDRHPFARRIVKSNQSYAFSISCDVSGSMFSGRDERSLISCAMTSMWMVAEALRVAGVNRSLSVFADNAVALTPINKQQVRWTDMNNEKKLSKAGGSTRIHYAMDQCREELEKVRAERKIMVIITDGDADGQRIKEAKKKADQAGIQCIGITIGRNDELTQYFGGESNVLIKPEQALTIGAAFIKILKDTIKVKYED